MAMPVLLECKAPSTPPDLALAQRDAPAPMSTRRQDWRVGDAVENPERS